MAVPELIATISLISVIITTLVLSNQTSKLNTKFKSSLSELVDKINYNQQLELKFDNKQLHDIRSMGENIGDVRKTYQRLDDLANNLATKSVNAGSVRGNNLVADENIRFNSVNSESSASLEYKIGRGDNKRDINRLQINTPNLVGSGFDITTTGFGPRFSIDSKSGDVYIPGKLVNDGSLTGNNIIGSNVTASNLMGKNAQFDRMKLGNKWQLSGVGDKDGNDSWLRVMDSNGNYNGGVAMAQLWTRDNSWLNGNTNVTGPLAATGGTNQLQDSWFPYSDGNTYIRSGSEGKDINIGDWKAKNVNIGKPDNTVNLKGNTNYNTMGGGDLYANNTKLSRNWTAFPDGRTDGSEIANDTNGFKQLMIVGNKSGGGERRVGVWDTLNVNGTLNANGPINANGAVNAPNGVKVTKGDPGPLIDVNYGANDNRYGIGQFTNGQTRVYTAGGGWQPGSVNLSVAKNDGSFVDGLTVSKDASLNPTTTVNNRLNVNGITSTGDLYANNTKMSGNWSGYPDGRTDGSEIANDTSGYKGLMIVGNKSGGGERRVGVWDTLNVNGQLNANGSVRVSGDLSFPNGKAVYGDGRLHIAPNEILYLLPKAGIQVGKEWGGTGTLNAQGTLSTNDKLCINGTCITESALQQIKKNANV